MRRTKKLFKTRASKEGLPPGSLIHIGEAPADAVSISVFSYDEQRLQENYSETLDLNLIHPKPSGVVWVDVEGVHQVETIRSLGEAYNLHPLALEDIVSTVQRPKVEDYDDYLFIVVKMLLPLPDGDFAAEQLSLVLGRGYVLTFQEGIRGDAFEPVRERIRSGKGKIRTLGADYLLYTLLDAVVDRYFTVLENFGERLITIEEDISLHPDPRGLALLHDLKKEAIYLRKSIWPLREVLSFLERDDTDLIGTTTRLFIRDVHDHTVQAIDTIETYRDLLSGTLDLYLSSISNRTNEIMKFLTIIGTIFIPLTFIVGLYGMNFKYMPELEWHYAYFGVLSLMVLITVGMIFYFKHRKWL
jgi:magnesium transporter